MTKRSVKLGVATIGVGLTLAAFATPAFATDSNPCGSKGAMYAPTGLDYAGVGDDDNSCGVVAIEFKTYAGGGTYTYTFRRQLDPVGGTMYYTNYTSGTAYSWRGCSYDNVGSYSYYCEKADVSWEFSTAVTGLGTKVFPN